MPQNIIDWSGFCPNLSLGPTLSIPTYYLIISLTSMAAVFWLLRRADRAGYSRVIAIDCALIVMSSGFIGARLFHVLFENPEFYLADPEAVFKFWNGGFVWYGGAITGALFGILFLRRKNENVGRWLDLVAPIGALAYILGRSACFATGCCYGRVIELDGGKLFRHPTQLYAMVIETIILIGLLGLERWRLRTPPRWLEPSGQIFIVWLCLHAVGRIVMEYFRGDPRGPAPLNLSVSTWISLILIVLATIAFRRNLFAKKSKTK